MFRCTGDRRLGCGLTRLRWGGGEARCRRAGEGDLLRTGDEGRRLGGDDGLRLDDDLGDAREPLRARPRGDFTARVSRRAGDGELSDVELSACER